MKVHVGKEEILFSIKLRIFFIQLIVCAVWLLIYLEMRSVMALGRCQLLLHSSLTFCLV